jgi:hypothetical protein
MEQNRQWNVPPSFFYNEGRRILPGNPWKLTKSDLADMIETGEIKCKDSTQKKRLLDKLQDSSDEACESQPSSFQETKAQSLQPNNNDGTTRKDKSEEQRQTKKNKQQHHQTEDANAEHKQAQNQKQSNQAAEETQQKQATDERPEEDHRLLANIPQRKDGLRTTLAQFLEEADVEYNVKTEAEDKAVPRIISKRELQLQQMQQQQQQPHAAEEPLGLFEEILSQEDRTVGFLCRAILKTFEATPKAKSASKRQTTAS